MPEVLLLGEAEVRDLLDLDLLVDAVAAALTAVSDGSASVPPRVAAQTPAGGRLAVMPGLVPDRGLAAKLVSYFPGNEGTGVPSHQALVAVFDPQTGTPLALMDGTYLTAVRTAAASMVAVRALARPRAGVVAVVGAGVQGESHLAAVGRLLAGAELRVASRSARHAAALAERHPPARAFTSIADAVRGADVVLLCTDAGRPILDRRWLARGAHVGSVGSAGEVDAATVAEAAIFVESRSAALLPFPAGVGALAGVDPERVTEVGEVLLGRRPGRVDDAQLTLYASMGHAAEDVAAATLVHRAAVARGLGTLVTL